MTRRIRKLHLVVWAVLAVMLPALLSAAWWLRHAEPVNKTVPMRASQPK